jgi:hypothetical protein
MKKDPVQMGELMYGAGTDVGRKMENTAPGDGYKYRGRGFIQLTGKKNYRIASMDIFKDDRLVKNPDLVNDPNIAALTVAWYMKKGMASMAKTLGINTTNMSQADANLLATSQIAGSDIRKKGAIGQEIMAKVDKYSGNLGGMQTAAMTPVVPPTAASTAPDMTSPSMQPQEPTSTASSDTGRKDDGGGAISTLVGAFATGLADLDKATGGKLGFASAELEALLRDKSFLDAFSTPIFADASKNMSTTDNVAIDEKTPSVYDENLLSKMRKA